MHRRVGEINPFVRFFPAHRPHVVNAALLTVSIVGLVGGTV